MDELFLETPFGNLQMDWDTAKKYHLKKGERSPFTGQIIVDGKGDATPEFENQKAKPPGDEPFNANVQMFTTAEALDIAQGADSTGGQ